MTMASDSYAEWLLRWVIKMIDMLHRFTSSVLDRWYLNTWKEKTILFDAYFIDARSSTGLSRLFSEKVIRLNDILDFSFVDTWILEKRRQFYSMHTSSTHDRLQVRVDYFQRKSSELDGMIWVVWRVFGRESWRMFNRKSWRKLDRESWRVLELCWMTIMLSDYLMHPKHRWKDSQNLSVLIYVQLYQQCSVLSTM